MTHGRPVSCQRHATTQRDAVEAGPRLGLVVEQVELDRQRVRFGRIVDRRVDAVREGVEEVAGLARQPVVLGRREARLVHRPREDVGLERRPRPALRPGGRRPPAAQVHLEQPVLRHRESIRRRTDRDRSRRRCAASPRGRAGSRTSRMDRQPGDAVESAAGGGRIRRPTSASNAWPGEAVLGADLVDRRAGAEPSESGARRGIGHRLACLLPRSSPRRSPRGLPRP